MSIWGKIGGGAAGLLLGGGPLGALMGALAGHALFDRGAKPPEESVAFTIGIVALSAKMAKADGLVTDIEFQAFRKVVRIAPEEEANVRRIFDLARGSTAGFEAYARQLAQILKSKPGALEDLLDGLFFIAAADRAIHEAEIQFLRVVADIFGISESAFNRLCAAYGGPCEPDPYALLLIDPDATDEAVRKAYLYQVREHHPDTLIARGVPEEFVDVATEKLKRVNWAWAQIQKERGIGGGA